MTSTNILFLFNEFDLIVSHKDYDFTCLFSKGSLSEKPITSRIKLSNKRQQFMCIPCNLSNKLQGAVMDTMEIIKAEQPKRINLNKAHGERLETFYTEWFNYIDKVAVLPFRERVIEIKDNISKSEKSLSKLLSKTNKDKQRHPQKQLTTTYQFCTVKATTR